MATSVKSDSLRTKARGGVGQETEVMDYQSRGAGVYRLLAAAEGFLVRI